MSWKGRIKVINDPKFYENGVAFETEEEARLYASDKHWNWTMAEDYDVIESDEPANYKWVEGTGIVEIEKSA